MTTKNPTWDDALTLLTFVSARRHNNSIYGNPTWWVTFENVGGEFMTSFDASVGYEVGNWRKGDKLAVKFTKADRIAYAYRVRMVNGRAVRIHN